MKGTDELIWNRKRRTDDTFDYGTTGRRHPELKPDENSKKLSDLFFNQIQPELAEAVGWKLRVAWCLFQTRQRRPRTPDATRAAGESVEVSGQASCPIFSRQGKSASS